jgi:LDH2 family malate/lactate/ureidoglycolate dehydrogenase
MKEIRINDLKLIIRKALSDVEISERESDIIFEHLLDGETTGHSSHGFMRMSKIINDLKTKEIGPIQMKDQTVQSVLFDGGNHTGIVVAYEAMRHVIATANQNGVATAGGSNVTGTIGQLGYFMRQIASEGLIGFMVVASEYAMAPWGGITPILGTNPIAFGFPTKDVPLVIDFASSAWSYGNLKLAMLEGKKIPAGIVIDADGNDSTDPNDADNGSQLPIAEHKGYALALAIEILGGLFVGGKAGYEAVKGTDGFFMMALKPNLFVSSSSYYENLASLIDEIRTSKVRPGVERIYLPGEKSQIKRDQFGDADFVELSEQVYNQIMSI